MLIITKIIEGGLDLSTNEELPRSIVVSNGSREITLPMANEGMEGLVQLYIDGFQRERTVHANQVVPSVADELVVDAKLKMTPNKSEEYIKLDVQISPENEPSDYDKPPPVAKEDGFLPGEDYEDSGTGAASL